MIFTGLLVIGVLVLFAGTTLYGYRKGCELEDARRPHGEDSRYKNSIGSAIANTRDDHRRHPL